MHKKRIRLKSKKKKKGKSLHPATLFLSCLACSFIFVLFIGNETQEYSLENLKWKDFIKVSGKKVQKTEKVKKIRPLLEKISYNK